MDFEMTAFAYDTKWDAVVKILDVPVVGLLPSFDAARIAVAVDVVNVKDLDFIPSTVALLAEEQRGFFEHLPVSLEDSGK